MLAPSALFLVLVKKKSQAYGLPTLPFGKDIVGGWFKENS